MCFGISIWKERCLYFGWNVRNSRVNGIDGIQSVCIFLKRFAYPCRYLDMISRFGRPVPELCLVSNRVMHFVYDRWGHLLETMNQQWLAPVNVQLFADTIHASGSPLDNCWGLLKGAFVRFVRLQKINTYCTKATKRFTRLSSSEMLSCSDWFNR